MILFTGNEFEQARVIIWNFHQSSKLETAWIWIIHFRSLRWQCFWNLFERSLRQKPLLLLLLLHKQIFCEHFFLERPVYLFSINCSHHSQIMYIQLLSDDDTDWPKEKKNCLRSRTIIKNHQIWLMINKRSITLNLALQIYA